MNHRAGPHSILQLFSLVRKQLGHKSCLLWTVDFLFRLPAGPDAVNTIDTKTNGPALWTPAALQSVLKYLLSVSVRRAPESALLKGFCGICTVGSAHSGGRNMDINDVFLFGPAG